jgi:hypothetical protein
VVVSPAPLEVEGACMVPVAPWVVVLPVVAVPVVVPDVPEPAVV